MATIDHYHIRWQSGKLDWETFHNEQEATTSAENLKQLNETYTIVPADGNCAACDGTSAHAQLRK